MLRKWLVVGLYGFVRPSSTFSMPTYLINTKTTLQGVSCPRSGAKGREAAFNSIGSNHRHRLISITYGLCQIRRFFDPFFAKKKRYLAPRFVSLLIRISLVERGHPNVETDTK